MENEQRLENGDSCLPVCFCLRTQIGMVKLRLMMIAWKGSGLLISVIFASIVSDVNGQGLNKTCTRLNGYLVPTTAG